jgi:predicted DNA-binding protein (MmcQ/YjbR family)
MMGDVDLFTETLEWARSLCLELPGTYEEPAWVGTRWMVRKRTFAHVLEIVDGYPPSFSVAAATRGPTTVLTFRSSGHELDAIVARAEFFGPLWNRGDLGVRLDAQTDWDELAELVVESYRLRAPTSLARQLDA